MKAKSCSAPAVCLFFSFLSSCSTQRPVRDLAERTAANAGVISAQLGMLAQESSDLADQRAANVSRLHAANAQLRANYNYDVALTKRSGGQSNLNLIGLLESWGKEVDDIFKAAGDAERERKAAILATQKALDPKSESLGQIAQALATLAHEESGAQRATFLAGYARELAGEIKIQLEQSNKSSTAAKKLLADVKGKP
jgi:hypothetical protein